MNKGFSYARGEYYTWTSDDNAYKPNALQIMSNYLDSHKGADLVEILSHKKNEITKALNDFVEAFSGNLQSVENDNKQEILQKCQNLLQAYFTATIKP